MKKNAVGKQGEQKPGFRTLPAVQGVIELDFTSLVSRRAKLLAAIASLVLLVLLFSQINLGELASALSKADARLLVAAVAVETISLGLRTKRWKILLDEKTRIRFATLFPIQCAGLSLSNFSPGKMADPVKVLFLKPMGVKYSFSLLTVVWERIFDLFVLFSAALLIASIVSTELAYAAFAAAVLLAAAGVTLHKKLAAVLAFFSRFRMLAFLKKARAHKFRKRTLAAALAATFVIWALDFSAMWLAFKAVGIGLDYLLLAGASSAAVIIGVITFLPGGLGSTDVSLLFLLSLSGYPQPQLLAGIVLARAATLGYSSLAGLAMLPFIKTAKKRKKQ
ncbi:MAG: lysylphosphatidylglycerol synthase transmembrane domain-containing protein [Candidatus Micrarchaeota archaeon]|nr:lysylphosphatidylglycerol synthase transmembrane domain-containing protein [Candidatus Micrarchaeota archaeon]